MTIALMIFATAAAYAAGIATMLVVSSRRSTLAEPIPPAWLPQSVKVEPPPKPPAPTVRSPFAPKPKAVEPPRKRLLHWPAAKPEPEPRPEPQSAPAARAGPARACLPENKWRSP